MSNQWSLIDEKRRKSQRRNSKWNKSMCSDWNIKLLFVQWAHTYTCMPTTVTVIGMGLLILIDAVNNHKIAIESNRITWYDISVIVERVNASNSSRSSNNKNISGRTFKAVVLNHVKMTRSAYKCKVKLKYLRTEICCCCWCFFGFGFGFNSVFCWYYCFCYYFVTSSKRAALHSQTAN